MGVSGFIPADPIHNLWDIFQRNGGTVELYQSNYGMAGNHEAGGFVNSAVKALCFQIFNQSGSHMTYIWVSEF